MGLQVNIIGNVTDVPGGFDAMIVKVPDHAYVSLGGLRTVDLLAAHRALQRATGLACEKFGHPLHHANWTITDDPEMVRTRGLRHDCATCRAGCDQALAYLAEKPGREVAVGEIWWVAPPD